MTWIGHASFLIQTAGLNILFDPVWSKRASIFAIVSPPTPEQIQVGTGPPASWNDCMMI